MRRTLGVTRRDPPKAIKDSTIPTAASLPGTAITTGPPVAPEHLGSGDRNGTKFLRDDGTWQPATAGSLQPRKVVVEETLTLDNLEDETGLIELAQGFIVLRVQLSAAARLRLYKSTAYRAADAGRAAGEIPTGKHGVILDVLLNDDTGLTWDMNNMTPDFNMESSPDDLIPYRLTNLSGSTQTITMTLTILVLEAEGALTS